MNIVVNGELREVRDHATVADILRLLEVGAGAHGVAVARNGDVVLRARWDELELRAGDRLEVLHAVQGG